MNTALMFSAMSDGISGFAHAFRSPTFATQIAQARLPFRLEGVASTEVTPWWRTAIDSSSTPWIVGGILAGGVLIAISVLATRILARLKARQPFWMKIATAIGLDRAERECLARLSTASGIAEPVALLMSPSVFGAAMQSGAASLAARDRAILLALAARHDWPIPAGRAAPASASKALPIVEAKLAKSARAAVGARAIAADAAGSPRKVPKAKRVDSKPSVKGSVGGRAGPVASDRRLTA